MTDGVKIPELTLENVRLIFRNFAGKESMYNRAGDRNFNVVIPAEEVERLTVLGWNVKVMEPREEGDLPTYYLPVAVGYKGARPPRIIMITSGGRTSLTEQTVEVLDWAQIINADLTVRPYEWTAAGKSGIKAYLQALYVTIQEDYLDRKYAIYDTPTGDN